ncbi:MAG TPA: phage portal protein [Gemmatimonadaceae bacterium]|nr:phage portal protein [Gemmatimonadaceae bacterium]
MTWWSKLFSEQRAVPQWQLSQLQSWSDMGIGPPPVTAGIEVTTSTAMEVPAVYSCVQVLSQDVARCPIKLRHQVAKDTYEDAVDHDLFEILGSLANPETTSYSFKLQMMQDVLRYEHAYAEIIRSPDGRVEALWRLDPTLMRIDRTRARVKRWTYNGSTTWTFDPSKPPIFELSHPSPIQQCREIIGTAAALQHYVAQFFANGARPGGVLQAQGMITSEQAANLKEKWLAFFGQGGARRGVAVLDGGLEFKPIASDNDESQMNETMAALNQMIAGVFRVPTWKIGDLTKTSYSNMEAGELAYVTSTLDPYFELWESSLRRDVLSTRQYGQFTITFDRSALVRNDVKALHDSLAQGIQSGIYSQNDARKMLGLNPIPDGNTYLINSALMPIGDANNGPTT